MEDPPPTKIDEFQLVRRLGQGGMGEVWLARDTLLERDVAIKFGLGAVSNESRLRFHVEARAVARLQHPNILAVHHAAELDDLPFLVTELLRGTSLDAVGRLPAAEVVAIGADLSRGLAAAHAAGVIHRDIKPANAFLCDDGTAKLLDFGLAQLGDDARAPPLEGLLESGRSVASASHDLATTRAGVSQSGRLTGTPLFMAPETWRGEPATQATDVYSLGGLLYTLLTGRPPYLAESVLALGAVVVGGELPDLASEAPDAPAALVDLVTRCLRLRPESRPSAEQACHTLQVQSAGEAERVVAEGGGESSPVDNPYRGLLAFAAEHRATFFGREIETAAVLTELAGASFVLVVGPSGAGKSSLVRAGVAPRVLAGALGRGAWRVASMSPGSRPVERLAHALAAVVGAPEAVAAAQIRLSTSWPAQRIEQVGGASVFLIIDQFEEAWTLASPSDRELLFEALAALAAVGPRVRVVATLRVDFLAHLEDLGEMRAVALRAPVMLGPLSSEGLERAIALPARRRGVEVDSALVQALVDAARGEAGMLPLLEFALSELWERRREGARRISLADLEALGGLEGALAGHADAAFARLSPRLRVEARRVLLALVTVERTRAVREERDLVGGGADGPAALGALVEARLVVASRGEESTAYTLAHEVLVSGWPSLRAWLDEESVARELQRRVGRAATEWERLGRRDEILWGPARLREIDASASAVGFSASERAFVAATRRRIARRRAARLAAVLSVPLLLAAAGLAAWAVSARRDRAAIARAVAEARARDLRAEEAARRADRARETAFATFDKDDLGPAEEQWKQALALEADADRLRRAVGEALDTALVLDPHEPVARAMYADVTLRRLVAAEQWHKDTVLGALRAQLGTYDDGSRAAWLRAPAIVRFETDPPGATLTLARYREDAQRRLVEGGAAPVVDQKTQELEPGSYLLVARAAGRYPTRLPFVVDRGERRTLRVALPRVVDVPEGMVYVPAGRTLYGSADDETTRGLLTHQPMHAVDVGGFLIARLEVTNAEYLSFLDALPAADRQRRLPRGLTVLRDGRAAWTLRDKVVLAPGELYCNGSAPCLDWAELPVMGLSRDDSVGYVQWLSGSGHLPGARLCTDREWERAARGADARLYPNGNGDLGPADACTYATYAGDALRAGPCAPGTHPATDSPFGVGDLAGSQAEWTAGPPDVALPAKGVTRGGGWPDIGLYVEIPNRGVLPATTRYAQNGVRVCADLRRDR